jgi:hypothetical protein
MEPLRGTGSCGGHAARSHRSRTGCPKAKVLLGPASRTAPTLVPFPVQLLARQHALPVHKSLVVAPLSRFSHSRKSAPGAKHRQRFRALSRGRPPLSTPLQHHNSDLSASDSSNSFTSASPRHQSLRQGRPPPLTPHHLSNSDLPSSDFSNSFTSAKHSHPLKHTGFSLKHRFLLQSGSSQYEPATIFALTQRCAALARLISAFVFLLAIYAVSHSFY